MSTARFDTLQNAAGSVSVPVNTVVNGSAKAFVNFNGTGTVAIRASGNVSSITDNGTGDYTANFTTAMPDVNYSPQVSVHGMAGVAAFGGPAVNKTFGLAAYRFNISGQNGANTLSYDPDMINVSIFR